MLCEHSGTSVWSSLPRPKTQARGSESTALGRRRPPRRVEALYFVVLETSAGIQGDEQVTWAPWRPAEWAVSLQQLLRKPTLLTWGFPSRGATPGSPCIASGDRAQALLWPMCLLWVIHHLFLLPRKPRVSGRNTRKPLRVGELSASAVSDLTTYEKKIPTNLACRDSQDSYFGAYPSEFSNFL